MTESRNFSIGVGGGATRVRSARRETAEVLQIDGFGVHPTAPPPASAGSAAAAFLAAISSAFWRISSAKRGT
jgi:hypothetical protein